ncbi:polysaccharide pyruvyl transferase family protein [Bacteroides cellulosilyticus]|nr:polysaccharide pyruvyl transferase family protein [Bacteroides cellulosilyticus]
MYSFTEKINLLKSLIDKGLLPLINSSCVYLDVPYHTNIGDTLIWEGTEQFLASNHIKCLYRNSTLTYYYRKISKKTTILLHGGGNFGDIWRSHQELRLRIIQEYPNNQIIILPQTIYYTDHSIMKTDALIMAKHPNLTICARDEISHSILKKYFHNNNILLLPDMAFYISPKRSEIILQLVLTIEFY